MSGAAERGLRTLRAPRYDLPASLVLALVLAHDPLPSPSLTPTYFLFITEHSSTFSACTLGDHFFFITPTNLPTTKKRLFFPFTRVQRLTITLRSNENRSGNFYLCYQILLDINVSSISTSCEKSEDRLYRAALFFLKLSLELR